MRSTFEKNAARFTKMLTRYVEVNFARASDLDGVISDSLFQIWANIDGIEERFEQSQESRGQRGSKAAYLYGCLRLEARWRALAEMRSIRRKRSVSINDETDDYELVGWQPRITTQPEQENVVFLKQLLQHCGSLPDEQAVIASLILDRATAQEMVDELGLSHSVLIERRSQAMRRLMEVADQSRQT